MAETVVHGRGELHLQRRLFHMLSGLMFPVLAFALEEKVFFPLLLFSSALVITGDVARLLFQPLNRAFVDVLAPLMRNEERRSIIGASYGLLGMLATFVLFRQDIDIAIVAVLFLALGDPVAAIVGIKFPRVQVYRKSLSGSAAMMAVGFAVVVLLHVTGVIDFRLAFLVGAIVATAFELAPLPINDNLTIPVGAGLAMWLVPV